MLWPLYNRFKILFPTEFQQRLKFCNDDEILEYIERKNLPIYLGGTFHHYDTIDNEQNNLYDKCQSMIDYGHNHGWNDDDIDQILLKLIKPNLVWR